VKIGVLGLGVVGNTILTVMKFYHHNVRGYDKYKPSDSFESVCDTDLVFVAVPTNEKDGRLDCSIVRHTLDQLEKNSYRGVICIKSTIAVGFLDEVRKSNPNLRIVYMPEFLHEKNSLTEFASPDYIVMSGKEEDINILRKAFFWVNDNKFFHVDDRTAEVTKLVVNAFAATKISFANEIGRICKEVGADAETVMAVLRRDKRCGEEYTDPTRGPYGGKCLPKDTRELINCTNVSILLKAVEETNEKMKKETKKWK
jgi:UDPglucose 6-dehydrogenase